MSDGSTPRPWRLEQNTTVIWGACNPDDLSTYGMGYLILECFITPMVFRGKSPDADEGEANARRIVAAVNATSDLPIEALEADVVRKLVEALEWLESYLRDTPHHNAPAAANARSILQETRGAA